jgi:hypothetical protein
MLLLNVLDWLLESQKPPAIYTHMSSTASTPLGLILFND